MRLGLVLGNVGKGYNDFEDEQRKEADAAFVQDKRKRQIDFQNAAGKVSDTGPNQYDTGPVVEQASWNGLPDTINAAINPAGALGEAVGGTVARGVTKATSNTALPSDTPNPDAIPASAPPPPPPKPTVVANSAGAIPVPSQPNVYRTNVTGPIYNEIRAVGTNGGYNPRVVEGAALGARIESNGGKLTSNPDNPRVRGLFQFDTDTAAGLGVKNRDDPHQNIAGGLASFGRADKLLPPSKLGHEASPLELYIVHQQGVGAGPALLTASPDASAINTIAPFYASHGPAGSIAMAASAIRKNWPGGIKKAPENPTVGEFLLAQKTAYTKFGNVSGDAIGQVGQPGPASAAPADTGPTNLDEQTVYANAAPKPLTKADYVPVEYEGRTVYVRPDQTRQYTSEDADMERAALADKYGLVDIAAKLRSDALNRHQTIQAINQQDLAMKQEQVGQGFLQATTLLQAGDTDGASKVFGKTLSSISPHNTFQIDQGEDGSIAVISRDKQTGRVGHVTHFDNVAALGDAFNKLRSPEALASASFQDKELAIRQKEAEAQTKQVDALVKRMDTMTPAELANVQAQARQGNATAAQAEMQTEFMRRQQARVDALDAQIAALPEGPAKASLISQRSALVDQNAGTKFHNGADTRLYIDEPGERPKVMDSDLHIPVPLSFTNGKALSKDPDYLAHRLDYAEGSDGQYYYRIAGDPTPYATYGQAKAALQNRQGGGASVSIPGGNPALPPSYSQRAGGWQPTPQSALPAATPAENAARMSQPDPRALRGYSALLAPDQ